jgi:hypothetical protein
MIITNLTPAGFRYLARLYEQAVTEGLDVGQIHAYLTRKGVAVTRSEVIDHLDNVFTYHGYAAANPAKPPISYADADAAMRKPARRLPTEKTIQLVNAETGVYNRLTDVSQSYTHRPTQ